MILLPGILSQGGAKTMWGKYTLAFAEKEGTAATASRTYNRTTYAANTYTIDGSSFKLTSPSATQFQNLTAGKFSVNINNSNTTTSSGSTLYKITSNSGRTYTQNTGSYNTTDTMSLSGSYTSWKVVKSITFNSTSGTFSGTATTVYNLSKGTVVYVTDINSGSLSNSGISNASKVYMVRIDGDMEYDSEGNMYRFDVSIAEVTASGSSTVTIGYTPYTLGHIRGEFIETVEASDPSAYPENGEQDGYWYVKYSDTTITWERYAVSQTAVEGSSTRATGVYNKYLKVGTTYSIENGEFAVTTTQSLRIRTATSSIAAPYTILADGTLSLQSSSQTTGDTVRGPMLGKLTQIAGSSYNMYADFIPYTINTGKGSYIDTVESYIPDEYPDDGVQDGYWYVKIS